LSSGWQCSFPISEKVVVAMFGISQIAWLNNTCQGKDKTAVQRLGSVS